jgi:putative transposase
VARKPREEAIDAIHHVYARGVAGRAIYVADSDRHVYLRLLEATVARREWRCLAYCLMGNHVHLLVETPRANLGDGMQGLHGDYVRYFNDRYRRRGPLFQSRFGSSRLKTDERLWSTAVYIARNPVEAWLCKRPDDWPWSSHAETLGRRPAPPWLDAGRLLSHFADDADTALQSYLTLVNAIE